MLPSRHDSLAAPRYNYLILKIYRLYPEQNSFASGPATAAIATNLNRRRATHLAACHVLSNSDSDHTYLLVSKRAPGTSVTCWSCQFFRPCAVDLHPPLFFFFLNHSTRIESFHFYSNYCAGPAEAINGIETSLVLLEDVYRPLPCGFVSERWRVLSSEIYNKDHAFSIFFPSFCGTSP